MKQKGTIINDFVMKNLIYCEDCHSFTYLLYEKWKVKFPENYRQAQEDAWVIVKKINISESKG